MYDECYSLTTRQKIASKQGDMLLKSINQLTIFILTFKITSRIIASIPEYPAEEITMVIYIYIYI